MVTESVMTLDAVLANVIAQKADVILQAKVDQLNLEDMVEKALEEFDTDRHFEKAVENAADNYDFDNVLDEVSRDYDWSKSIETALEEAEIEAKVVAAVEKHTADLRERVVAMVAQVARDEVRKALDAAKPAPKPSLLARLRSRFGW